MYEPFSFQRNQASLEQVYKEDKTITAEIRFQSKRMKGRILEGFEVGKDIVLVSHLQFTDDAIFFCSKKESLFFFNYILAFFESMSGLKLNRGKCQITGLNFFSIESEGKWGSGCSCGA